MSIRWEDAAGAGSRPARRHLFGPFWSSVEHAPDQTRRLWTWAVVREDRDDEPVAEGFAYDARDAQQAVDEWARRHRPRGIRGRLRRP